MHKSMHKFIHMCHVSVLTPIYTVLNPDLNICLYTFFIQSAAPKAKLAALRQTLDAIEERLLNDINDIKLHAKKMA